MKFARGPNGLRFAVGEREFLTMAARARLGAVPAHALVIEKVAPRFDLFGGDQLAGWNIGLREARRKTPLKSAALSVEKSKPRDVCQATITPVCEVSYPASVSSFLLNVALWRTFRNAFTAGSSRVRRRMTRS